RREALPRALRRVEPQEAHKERGPHERLETWIPGCSSRRPVGARAPGGTGQRRRRSARHHVARNALIAEHGELSFHHPHVDTDVPPPTLLVEVLLASLDAVECAATRYLALRNDTEVF